MIKQGKKDKEGGKISMEQEKAKFSARDITDAIRVEHGNNIIRAIVKALKGDGITADVEPVDTGYVLRAKGALIYFQDSFAEDENDLRVPGSLFDIDALRLPWMRNAIIKAFDYKSEERFYRNLVKEDFFFHAPWTGEVYFQLIPVKIFDDSTLEKLGEARRKIDMGSYYASYFDGLFDSVLPTGFELMGPYNPSLKPKTVKALLSIINEDEDYKAAIESAKKIAQDLIDDVKKDVQAVKEKIISQV